MSGAHGTWRTTSSPARAMLGSVPTSGAVVLLGGFGLLVLVRLDPAGFALAAAEVFGVFVAVPAVTVAAIRRARRPRVTRVIEDVYGVTARVIESPQRRAVEPGHRVIEGQVL